MACHAAASSPAELGGEHLLRLGVLRGPHGPLGSLATPFPALLGPHGATTPFPALLGADGANEVADGREFRRKLLGFLGRGAFSFRWWVTRCRIQRLDRAAAAAAATEASERAQRCSGSWRQIRAAEWWQGYSESKQRGAAKERFFCFRPIPMGTRGRALVAPWSTWYLWDTLSNSPSCGKGRYVCVRRENSIVSSGAQLSSS